MVDGVERATDVPDDRLESDDPVVLDDPEALLLGAVRRAPGRVTSTASNAMMATATTPAARAGAWCFGRCRWLYGGWCLVGR